MRKIRMTRLATEREVKSSPIEEGTMSKFPSVGSVFYIQRANGEYLRTSIVREVFDASEAGCSFRTLNSTYKIEVL